MFIYLIYPVPRAFQPRGTELAIWARVFCHRSRRAWLPGGLYLAPGSVFKLGKAFSTLAKKVPTFPRENGPKTPKILLVGVTSCITNGTASISPPGGSSSPACTRRLPARTSYGFASSLIFFLISPMQSRSKSFGQALEPEIFRDEPSAKKISKCHCVPSRTRGLE